MSTNGIEAVFLTTHNWGKSAKFFQSLGYQLEFETDHQSGQLRNGTGPYLFIAEVPETETPQMQLVMTVPDAAQFKPASNVEVVTPFFPSSGTGQINAIFPVAPMPRAIDDIGRPRAAALAGGRL